MTTGALFFAFNNEHTDYLALAAWNANRVRHHLGIPVAVVTNITEHGLLSNFDQVIQCEAEAGGKRYFDDYASSVTWYNANRTDAYSLTPWEHTLVLDADYVVNSNNLQVVLAAKQDFMCFRDAFDMSKDHGAFAPTFGRYNFPMWWATVMMFRKSSTAQYIFDAMHMIRQNWNHYRELYGIDRPNYRNDYALSIALGIMSGHTLRVDAIPWPMPSVMPDCPLRHENGNWIVNFLDQKNKPKEMMFSGMDFHAMGKRHLEAAIADHT